MQKQLNFDDCFLNIGPDYIKIGIRFSIALVL